MLNLLEISFHLCECMLEMNLKVIDFYFTGKKHTKIDQISVHSNGTTFIPKTPHNLLFWLHVNAVKCDYSYFNLHKLGETINHIKMN